MISEGNSQIPSPQQEPNDTNPIKTDEQINATSNQPEKNQLSDIQEKKTSSDNEEDTEDDDSLPSIGDEELIDMFSYYFIKFNEENNNLASSPSPSYFTHLSHDQKHLLGTFKKYYDIYKNQH